MLTIIVVCRKRRVVGRHDMKAVSVDAVNTQAAFCHHLKKMHATANPFPLPVQLNPDHDPPVSGPLKLVPRTPGPARCPVCYDTLVPVTGKCQSRDHVTHAGNDVTMGGGARGRCLVANSVRRINSFSFISSV